METAYNVYKTHPDFDKIKFVVIPWMRESLNISSDVPLNVEHTMKKYKELIPQLDDSALNDYEDKLHYFIEDMPEEIKTRILGKIRPTEADPIGTNAYDLVLEEAKVHYPDILEPKWNIYDRAQRVKKFVNDYLEQHQIPE